MGGGDINNGLQYRTKPNRSVEPGFNEKPNLNFSAVLLNCQQRLKKAMPTWVGLRTFLFFKKKQTQVGFGINLIVFLNCALTHTEHANTVKMII